MHKKTAKVRKTRVFDKKYFNSKDWKKDLRRTLKLNVKNGTYSKNIFDDLFFDGLNEKKSQNS